MSKKRELKTLEDLRLATLAILPADSGHRADASGSKHVITTQELGCRSVSELYSCDLYWYLPQDRGGIILASGMGKTMPEALEKCRHHLRMALDERGRKRRIAAMQAAPVRSLPASVRALPAPPMKCLEYQP